jgi:hypothetical protein
MTDYTVLSHLLKDMFDAEDASEIGYISRAADDCILKLAEQIIAKRVTAGTKPTKMVPEGKAPELVRFGDDVRITLGTKVFNSPINSIFVYRSNEVQQMEAEGIRVNPGKDGNTWYIKMYRLVEDKVVTNSKTLEPYEGPILYELLAKAKAN